MKRFLAISLLLVFLSGQFNLTWAKHFCGSIEVVNSMTFGKEELSCGMVKESCCSEDSSISDGPILGNVQCCTNDYYSADSDDFFGLTDNSLDNQEMFAASFILSLFDLTPNTDRINLYTASSPPLILCDKQVWYQTFLL